MRKDRRERRSRNTLTVDFGVFGGWLCEKVRIMLAEHARSVGRTSGSRMSRGKAIRVALSALAVAMERSPSIVDEAIDKEQVLSTQGTWRSGGPGQKPFLKK